MKIDVSDEKINKFRELVNDNSSFVCKQYKIAKHHKQTSTIIRKASN